MKPAVLYLSYDGVLEPLGESQVVSYLECLAVDHAITLLSFERPDDVANAARVTAMAERLSAHQIEWVRLKYHKWPPVLSTAVDVFLGISRARRIARKRRIQIIHARSYVPALIALGTRSASRAAFLFDMRGFWVDEKVEAKHWTSGGLLYRMGKWWERRFYAGADAVVSLTAAGVRAMPALGVRVRPGTPIEVIPTCADLRRFAPGPKDPELLNELGLDSAPVVGCVGTMVNWYMRHEMLDALACLSRRLESVQILIVTHDDHSTLRTDLEAAGVPPDRVVIARATFADMPRYIRLFDAGLFFIKPTFSKTASAATKLAEFLGCGVPIIINDGVGDSGEIVRNGRVGVVLSSAGAASLEVALPEVRFLISDPSIAARCRQIATELFDLQAGADRYRSLYRRLLSAGSPKN